MIKPRPIFLFAFANDAQASLRLGTELNACEKALAGLHDRGRLQFVSAGYPTLADLYDRFDRFPHQVCFFHYGGHSDGEGLQLMDTDLRADSLATILGREKELQLVFLNGCANAEQVQMLWEKGVKAVIATTAKIDDEHATHFAERFYLAIAGGYTIGEAFDKAASFITNDHAVAIKYISRGQGLEENGSSEFPWGMYVQDESVLNWHINLIVTDEQQRYGDKLIPKVLNQPPFMPEVFLGRNQDLEAVYQKLFAGDNLLLLVNGEGGIGKTTLAAQYYHRYQDRYRHLAWVFTGDSLLDSLLTLAFPLKVSFPETMLSKERLKVLIAAMNNLEKPCLLVIDNANNLTQLEQYYGALRACRNFHLLLTTRITEFEQAAAYRIGHLAQADAFTLFKKYYPGHQATEDELLAAILSAVEYNTLVVELLAKNLRNLNRLERKYSLQRLWEDLQSKGLLALSATKAVQTLYQGQGALRRAKPEAIIGAMYDLDRLSGAEVQLLSVFAVLPAENLGFSMIRELLPDLAALEDILLALAQRGWLDYQEVIAAFKISPVVQGIVLEKNRGLLDDCRPLISALIEKLAFEPGIGHFINVSYEDAVLLVRYAENALARLVMADSGLGILAERVGNGYDTLGNLDLALSYFEQCRDIHDRLLQYDPENADHKNNLAISYQYLGTTYSSLGKLEEALIYYEDYNRLKKELYESYPSNVSFKNGLAISYQHLGTTYSSLGKLEEALVYYEDFNRLEKELYESFPSNVSFKDSLAISYQHLGITYSSLGKLEEALVYYEDYNRLEKELHESFPSKVNFKNNLAISYQYLGNTHRSLGKLEEALVYYGDYNRLEKELHESFRSNVNFKNGLAISYQHLGNTYRSLGKLEEALVYYEDFNRLEKELYESYPSNVSFKNNLAISYWKLGDIHQKLGQKYRSYWLEAEQLWAELARDFPSYVEFGENLAFIREKLAE